MWYEWCVPTAQKIRNWVWGKDKPEIDELINAAWLDTLRRVPVDADIRFVRSVARRSMVRYVLGSRGKDHNTKEMHRRMQRIYDDEGSLLIWHIEDKRHQFTYDDAHDLQVCLSKYSYPIRCILYGKLQGKTHKEIGNSLGITESAVSLRLIAAGLKNLPRQKRSI